MSIDLYALLKKFSLNGLEEHVGLWQIRFRESDALLKIRVTKVLIHKKTRYIGTPNFININRKGDIPPNTMFEGKTIKEALENTLHDFFDHYDPKTSKFEYHTSFNY